MSKNGAFPREMLSSCQDYIKFTVRHQKIFMFKSLNKRTLTCVKHTRECLAMESYIFTQAATPINMFPFQPMTTQ